MWINLRSISAIVAPYRHRRFKILLIILFASISVVILYFVQFFRRHNKKILIKRGQSTLFSLTNMQFNSKPTTKKMMKRKKWSNMRYALQSLCEC